MAGPLRVPGSFDLDLPKELFRIGRASYWSTLKLAGGSSHARCTYLLFVAAAGQVGQGFSRGSSEADTNLLCGGKLPGDFQVDTIEWSVRGGSPEDHRAVMAASRWRWEFEQSLVDGSPLDTFDVRDLGTLPDKDRVEEVISLLRDRNDALHGRLTYPQTSLLSIPKGCSFCVHLILSEELPRLSGDVFVRFTLSGLGRRAVPIA